MKSLTIHLLIAGDDAKEVRVAGRVIARRVMGKLAFVTLRDDSGTIQLYVDKSRLETGPEGFKQLKGLIDVGDFIGAAGTLKRTDKGELSVVSKWLQVRIFLRPDQQLSGTLYPHISF